MTVRADLGDGSLTHEAVPGAAKTLPFLRPISDVVRLGVEGGRLKGKATVSFTVPADVQVPAGERLEDVVFIASRSDAPDASWEDAGGVYDPATRVMSTETTHFSEWTLSVTDPEIIRRDLAVKKSADSNYLSRQLTETLIGKYAPPACTSPKTLEELGVKNPILVPIRIADPAPPPLEICDLYLTAKESGSGTPGYYVEISNPHDFPLVLDLPASVTKLDEPNADTTLFKDLYRLATEDKDNARFQPREKRRFTVKQADLVSEFQMRGDLDFTTFLMDLALTMFDFAAEDNSAKATADKSKYLDEAARNKDTLTCMHKVAETVESDLARAKAKELPGKLASAAQSIVNDCLGAVLDLANDLLSKARSAARFFVRSVKKSLTLALKAPDIADAIREFAAVNSHSWRNALGAFDGDYRPTVDLRPFLANLAHILPPPGGRFVATAPRAVLPGEDDADFQFLPQCKPAAPAPALSWFEGGSDGTPVGVASYDLVDGGVRRATAIFNVVKVKDAQQSALATYIRTAKADCFNGIFRQSTVKGPPVAKDVAARMVVQTRAGDPDGDFIIMAARGDWLIRAFLLPGDAGPLAEPVNSRFVDDSLEAVLRYTTAVTGTQFAAE
ncbi:hypothetical protein [Paractinoplanes maris]|uniref:hypothetical protein n=1 Tax=Paractinoplanes maris TaxID=1734446 RepID=UPI00202177CA|nr:hypothetical protein [Actinoplanes maris]